jgi:hypothetical protein
VKQLSSAPHFQDLFKEKFGDDYVGNSDEDDDESSSSDSSDSSDARRAAQEQAAKSRGAGGQNSTEEKTRTDKSDMEEQGGRGSADLSVGQYGGDVGDDGGFQHLDLESKGSRSDGVGDIQRAPRRATDNTDSVENNKRIPPAEDTKTKRKKKSKKRKKVDAVTAFNAGAGTGLRSPSEIGRGGSNGTPSVRARKAMSGGLEQVLYDCHCHPRPYFMSLCFLMPRLHACEYTCSYSGVNMVTQTTNNKTQ